MSASFKRTTNDVRDKVLAYFKKHSKFRPVIVGDLCHELHANLSEVIVWVDELTFDGTILQVSKEETKRHGLAGCGYRLP